MPTKRPVLTSTAVKRLHLVDDQVAARLQPDLALERAVDLDLDAEAVEDRIVAVVELDVPGEVGHERAR